MLVQNAVEHGIAQVMLLHAISILARAPDQDRHAREEVEHRDVQPRWRYSLASVKVPRAAHLVQSWSST
jgi:hypothetical protein